MIPYQRFVVVLGQRFYDETAGNFTGNNYNAIKHYTYGTYRNAAQITYTPNNWVNAAMAGIGEGHNGCGPIWASCDADAVQRSRGDPCPGKPDIDGGFFFSASSLAALRT